jgi:hypothetical protein
MPCANWSRCSTAEACILYPPNRKDRMLRLTGGDDPDLQEGLYCPKTSRRASETSPTVARFASASFIG